MDNELWTAVDQYTTDRLLPPDPALDAALKAREAAGLPSISVSPSQGKMLMLLAQLARASRILEVGTLGGYSSIWLARALKPGGRLITLEANPKHAEVASANIANAGFASAVEVRLGDGHAGIEKLAAEMGAVEPQVLAHQLALLIDGAIVAAMVSRDPGVADTAGLAAASLFEPAKLKRPKRATGAPAQLVAV